MQERRPANKQRKNRKYIRRNDRWRQEEELRERKERK